jgi:hypothetical protein
MPHTGNETLLCRTATIVLRLSALCFFGVAALAVFYLPEGEQARVIRSVALVVPLVIAVGLAAASVLPAATRVGCMISAIVFIAGFLGMDQYLSTESVLSPHVTEVRRLGVHFDSRSLKDAVLDRRAHGDHVILPMWPADYLFGFGEVVPLSSASRSRIVLCNEFGSFETIETDEYGFNNPPGTWEQTGVDVLLLGDSFIEGYCVPREARMAEVVRARYPRTVNLGRGGFGPLAQLAVLREFAPALRPKVTVWNFFDNDWEDLRNEIRVPTLMRYLREQHFTQNLYGRRDEISRLVNTYVEHRIEHLAGTRNLPFTGTRQFVHHWVTKLLNRGSAAEAAIPEDATEHFAATLREAQRVARHLGSELVFVHLRDFRSAPSENGLRASEIAARLGIPAIDLADAVHRALPDPRDMHRVTARSPVHAPGNMAVHYNVQGHRLTGEVIAAAIARHLGVQKPRHMEGGNEPFN